MTRPSEGFQDATTMRDIYLANLSSLFSSFLKNARAYTRLPTTHR